MKITARYAAMIPWQNRIKPLNREIETINEVHPVVEIPKTKYPITSTIAQIAESAVTNKPR